MKPKVAVLALLLVLTLASLAWGQCPGGVCPKPPPTSTVVRPVFRPASVVRPGFFFPRPTVTIVKPSSCPGGVCR
jgi:hypothetical protein